jgi:hypothetical protein
MKASKKTTSSLSTFSYSSTSTTTTKTTTTSIDQLKQKLLDAITLCRRMLDVSASVHGKEAVDIWIRALQFEKKVAKLLPFSSSLVLETGTRKYSSKEKNGATSVYERALLTLNDTARAEFSARTITM